MKQEKEIKIEVISLEGHTDLSLAPKEALEKIRELTEKEGKWLYLDGDYVTSESLTEADLIEADHILLTNKVAGGGVMDSYNIRSEIKKEGMEHSMSITIEEDIKNIKVDINGDHIQRLARVVSTVSKGFKDLAYGEATKIVNSVAVAYGHGAYETKTNSAITLEYAKQKEDVNLDVDLNTGKIVIAITDDEVRKILVINKRDWVSKVIERYVSDFVTQEISDTREAVNI